MDPNAVVEAVIEIPRGSRNKYEIDKSTGVIRLDRVLYSSVHYPTDYGFIDGTLAGDGDALDILVLVQEPTFPGCRVPARPVGVLRMHDDKGEDDKVIAVPAVDPRYEHVRELADAGEHWQREIETFFRTYKLLEGRETRIGGWAGRETAWQIIEAARAQYPQSGH